MEGLDSMRFSQPTPIQQQAIPIILQNHDIIACAQTGTGKTAAYVLPLLHKIINTDHRHLNTLILAPTRELAQQIDQQIEGLAYFMGVTSVPIYGGGDGFKWEQQRKAMAEGVDIMIATPGRLIALLVSGDINLKHLQHLVLDEADRMLDMGFYEDILRIISYLPSEKRQTLLFSATMPPKIRVLAQRILRNPQQVNISISQPAEGINQQVYYVQDEHKLPLIRHLLSEKTYESVLMFAGTKEKVKQLEGLLARAGIRAKAFHSDLQQSERENILLSFKSRQLPVLVGTDVLSRGIDVEGISLVVNYDVPPDPEDYIHRIGRTARAQTTGTAITFVNGNDYQKFMRIENLLSREIPKIPLPEHIGVSPVFTSESRPKPSGFRRKPGGRPKQRHKS
jgi:ATP-dependent RNA helicase RhlE